ncbi:MAG TPA: oligosaccharide flippase family protein, partial [Candidatus Saccharimonadia bacterium]|nr:oligosaccharide flippase family protein [Candidatus Saccharimonadia bacterium]
MIDIDEIRHRSVKGVISYAFRTLALQLIGFVATVLLGYYLSPADFGIYFVVSAVIGFFTFLSDIGLAAALVQKKEPPTLEELRTSFTIQQLLACTIFVLILILSPIFRSQNHLSQDGVMLMYALGFSFILVSFKTIPSILLERQLRFDKLVLPQIFENLIFYAIAIALAAHGYGVRSYTYAVLARSVIGIIVIYSIQRWPIGFAFGKNSLRGLLKYGAKFQLNDLLARV